MTEEVRNRISGIKVRGFKSICTEQRIEIRPLTILAGANSAGKSSFMQPLLLLKQTLEAPSDPGALLLDGENVRYTKADQLISHIHGKGSNPEFAVCVELAMGSSLELVFHQEKGKGFELARMVYTESKGRTITITPDMKHEQIVGFLPPHLKTILKDLGKEGSTTFNWRVRRYRCFFTFELASAGEPKRGIAFGPSGVSPGHGFVSYIQGVIHLPGLRGNPRRTYQKTAGGPDFQGTFELYVASVISQWQANSGSKLIELGKALETMGLTWNVKAKPVDDTQVELMVGRLPHGTRGGARDLVSIADVGFGVSQALPVVVALLVARPGQLVYLEQPEIHLHPLAQRRLADVLVDAATRGIVVVVETHSALLLREVQTLVAVGRLPKADVKLHWVQRSGDGCSVVNAADVDDKGAYGDWPEDFDQTELEAEKSYLDAVE